MSGQIQKMINETGPLVKEKIKMAENKPEGVVQTVLEEVIDMSIKSNLAYYQSVFPRNTHVHPMNRQGTWGWMHTMSTSC